MYYVLSIKRISAKFNYSYTASGKQVCCSACCVKCIKSSFEQVTPALSLCSWLVSNESRNSQVAYKESRLGRRQNVNHSATVGLQTESALFGIRNDDTASVWPNHLTRDTSDDVWRHRNHVIAYASRHQFCIRFNILSVKSCSVQLIYLFPPARSGAVTENVKFVYTQGPRDNHSYSRVI